MINYEHEKHWTTFYKGNYHIEKLRNNGLQKSHKVTPIVKERKICQYCLLLTMWPLTSTDLYLCSGSMKYTLNASSQQTIEKKANDFQKHG